jgi:hypothetical protein
MEIAIKERLTADRLTSKINQRVKYRYSKTAVTARMNICFNPTTFNSALIAKGLDNTSDCPFQKPILLAEYGLIPLAITKFTDQSKVAHNANKTPFVWLFIF